jgi:Tol biopolymer transport system component
MVPSATYSGSPDGTLSPHVTVCEWKTDTDRCGTVVADFGMQGGTGSEIVRYDATAGQYIVNWDTKTCVSGACVLDAAKSYRLRVFVGGSQLGFADLQLVNSGSQLKNEKTGTTVTLLNGRTLPLKFRIEKGAVSVIANGSSASIGSTGGTVSASDASATLDIPAGALPAPLDFTISPAAAAPAGTISGLAPIVDLGPTGTTFNAPVVLTLPFEPSKLPPGVPASALGVYTADGANGWVPVAGSVVDEATGTVSAPIMHFSVYSLMVTPNTTTGSVVPASVAVGQTTTVKAQAFAYETVPGQVICYPIYTYVQSSWWGGWTRVQVGQQCTQTQQTYYYSPQNLAVYWASSSTGVASVDAGPTYTDASGIATSPPVLGRSRGSASVTATAGGLSSSISVTVRTAAQIVGVSARNGPFDVYIMDADGSNQRALAPTTDAEEEYADVSWDGSTVVFESSRTGAPRQVFKIGTDGTGLTQLVNMGSYSRMPRISPDGRKVLFYSNAEGAYNLYIVDITATNAGLSDVRRVTTHPADDAYGEWSPDQQRVAFSSNRTGSWQIFTRDLTTGYERQVTFDAGDNTFPRWQPNGNRLVYYNQASRTMWVVDADNGQPPIRVAPPQPVDWPANWSPDGSRLLFVSANRLYTVDPASPSSASPLTGSAENMIAQSWRDPAVPLPQPQSGLIALLSTRDSRPGAPTNHVFIMNPDGSNMRGLGFQMDVQDEYPDLLPDRSAVVFGSTRTGSFQVFKVPTAGGTPAQLTNLGFYTRAPAVSPDGQRVAFYSDAEGRFNLYAVGINATRAGLADVQKLTSDPDDEILPTWGPDNQRIAFSSNRTGVYQLYVKDLTTSAERQITFDAGDKIWARWAPTGSRVAFINAASNTIWVIDVDAGTPANQITPPPGSDGAMAWSPDGRKLLFGTARAGLSYSQMFIVNDDGSNLRRFSFTTEDLGAASWR